MCCRLRIANAQLLDTGNYTCMPTTAEAASVVVNVINGKCGWGRAIAACQLHLFASYANFVNSSCLVSRTHTPTRTLTHTDESPAAMQKSGAHGSCLSSSSSIHFSLILALAASAVVRWHWRWMGWLPGSGTLSLVHINYGGRQSISNSTPRRQPQPQLQLQHLQQQQQLQHQSQPMDLW